MPSPEIREKAGNSTYPQIAMAAADGINAIRQPYRNWPKPAVPNARPTSTCSTINYTNVLRSHR